ncbi:MAG: 50S ribosomal protein L24 [Alkalinema sp. CAN_BIN05]|nr:50S ribosomal protein L24 [Alkalinema sp. CAN_BIN05]
MPKVHDKTAKTAKKLHVKSGDTVMVIAGHSKGTIAEVIKAIPSENQVIVKGVNMQTKHVKPQGEGETGRIDIAEAPIHASNVQLYSTKESTVSRVGSAIKDGKKVRILKKTGEILD